MIMNIPYHKLVLISPVLDIYYEFIVFILLATFLNILGNGYKNLKSRLEKLLKNLELVDEMSYLVAEYRVLGETIEFLNSIFGFQLFLITFHTGLQILDVSNFILNFLLTNANHTFFYHVLATITLTTVFSLVCKKFYSLIFFCYFRQSS